MGKNALKCLVSLACWCLTANSQALAITDVELKSSLNQPLHARIKLLDAKQDDLDSLKIQIREMTAEYNQRSIKLDYEIQQDEGGHYIRISSREPVREPILTFVLDADWSKGHFQREYSLVLDPQ